MRARAEKSPEIFFRLCAAQGEVFVGVLAVAAEDSNALGRNAAGQQQLAQLIQMKQMRLVVYALSNATVY